MDVDLTIRIPTSAYARLWRRGRTPQRRFTRRADLGSSLTETMREARRLYEITRWPDRE